MDSSSSKYYYDHYFYEKLLTEEQIEELKKLENNTTNLFFKLKSFLVTRETYDRYNNEYFKGINVRGNNFLKDLKLEQNIFNTIQDEQRYHVTLLHISNFISTAGKEKLYSLIERGVLRRVGEVIMEDANYSKHLKLMASRTDKYEKAVEEDILKSMPPVDKIFDDFDMIPFYRHAKVFNTKNYINEDNTQNISKFLEDIISFLPDHEIFGDVKIEKRDDGRDIYYYAERDLMITIEVNGITYSQRSTINTRRFHGNYQTEFNPTDRPWKFNQILDIFNKIYREIGSETRLHLISDLPNQFNDLNASDRNLAVLVGKKASNHRLQQEGIGFLGFNLHNNIDPDFNFLNKDFDTFLDKVNETGLLDSYTNNEIEHVKHLGQSKFLHAPERLLWLFDFFVMAICPRENDSYKNFMTLIPKLTQGKILLENVEEDFENGKLSFTLNGQSYSTSNLSKNSFDPFFMLFVNEALADQELGAFYLWANEFDPHEQFSVIYSSPEIMKKVFTLRYPAFLELSDETIGHWRN